jgi:aryl-alcohol dehydrogenase-like predicted oxidoreductase
MKMPAWEFQALQNVARKHGWHQFISMQNYYNLLYREEEREMIPYCKDTGVGCIPVSLLLHSSISSADDGGSTAVVPKRTRSAGSSLEPP